MTQRIAMGVEYDGTRFYGWQAQAQEPTVQLCVEAALAEVADQPVRIHGSGRTDTGVHARCQVFHFDTDKARSLRAWLLGANTNLPEDVAIIWCREVPDDFDARRSASGRGYRYQILNRWPRAAIDRLQATWIRHPLDAARMHEAAQCLVGEHDFTSFRSVRCQARHAVRRIRQIEVGRIRDRVTLKIEGNAFLHHMVRNIVGVLIEVGRGDRPVEWVAEILDAGDRAQAGITAPAEGLCLETIRYPAQFDLPLGPDRPEDVA